MDIELKIAPGSGQSRIGLVRKHPGWAIMARLLASPTTQGGWIISCHPCGGGPESLCAHAEAMREHLTTNKEENQ